MSLEYPSRACLHPFTDKHSSAVMSQLFLGATELGQCHRTHLGRLTAESLLEQDFLPLPVVYVDMASCKRTACTSSKQTTLIFQLGLGMTFTEGDYKPGSDPAASQQMSFIPWRNFDSDDTKVLPI